MRTDAFTLLETICVVAIVSALAALLYPVFGAARDQGLRAGCASNLRQIFLETALYREQYDPVAYGDAHEMGLPPQPAIDHIGSLLTLRCPLAPHPATPMVGKVYWQYFSNPENDNLLPTWKQTVLTYEDRTVLYADPFHNNPSLSLEWGKHLTRRLAGIDLGGTLVRKSATGDWMIRDWWFAH